MAVDVDPGVLRVKRPTVPPSDPGRREADTQQLRPGHEPHLPGRNRRDLPIDGTCCSLSERNVPRTRFHGPNPPSSPSPARPRLHTHVALPTPTPRRNAVRCLFHCSERSGGLGWPRGTILAGRRGDLRAGPADDDVRADRRAARNGDPARPARRGTRLPPERELVRAARDLPLDAAPGDHGARAERPPHERARSRRRHVRDRVAPARRRPGRRHGGLARRSRLAHGGRDRLRRLAAERIRPREVERLRAQPTAWTAPSSASTSTAVPTSSSTSGSRRPRVCPAWSRR